MTHYGLQADSAEDCWMTSGCCQANLAMAFEPKIALCARRRSAQNCPNTIRETETGKKKMICRGGHANKTYCMQAFLLRKALIYVGVAVICFIVPNLQRMTASSLV